MRSSGFLMPAEWEWHERTWMAYGATVGVWGEDLESAYGRDLTNARIVARQDLVRIAANVSRFEPVTMLVDSEQDEAEARGFLAAIVAGSSVKDQFGDAFDGSGRIFVGEVRLDDLPPIGTHPLDFLLSPLNDLWARDTAPVFVADGKGGLHGVDLNFNGWGQWPITTGLPGWAKDPRKTENGIVDQPIGRDRKVAAAIAQQAGVPLVETWLTMEGGGLEVNGAGLALATESCILNPNRNPGKSKKDVEAELLRLFGVEETIWLPGRPGIDLTDWHIDFIARFTHEDHIVYADDRWATSEDKRDMDKLRKRAAALDLTAEHLPVPDVELVYDAFALRNDDLPLTERSVDAFSDTAAPGYVGYYEANGCVVMAQFGDDDADDRAFWRVSDIFPDKIVLSITTDGLCVGGGSIHCATQQQPAV